MVKSNIAIKRVRIVIGIDPDVDKNGVGYLDCETKKLEVSSLSFPDLMDYLKYVQREAEVREIAFRVVIEAGWLNKAHWHLKPKDTKAGAAAKGNHAGRNHETGRKIEEMCKHWQIPYELIKPLPKDWKGADRKITHDELASFTGITGRTNQEGRDAALIAWVWAGFSVKKG